MLVPPSLPPSLPQVVCVNLRPPCWRLPMLAFDGQQLNYALYDKKVNNYE